MQADADGLILIECTLWQRACSPGTKTIKCTGFVQPT